MSVDKILDLSGSLDKFLDKLFARCVKVSDGYAGPTAEGVYFCPTEDTTINIWDMPSKKIPDEKEEREFVITCTVPSPDGKILATGSSSNVYLWDMWTGKCIYILRGHFKTVASLSFSSDGKSLASSSIDQTIRMWDLSKLKCIITQRGNLWSVPECQCSSIIKTQTGTVLCLDFSSDGKFLAGGSDDKHIRVWRVSDSHLVNIFIGEPAEDWVSIVKFSPNGSLLATCSRSKNVRILDLESKECKILKEHKCIVSVICFSSDGERLAAGSTDGSIKLWNIDTFQCIYTLKGHASSITGICFYPDRRFIASSDDGPNDRSVKLWDLTKDECIFIRKEYSDIACISFSPVKELLINFRC